MAKPTLNYNAKRALEEFVTSSDLQELESSFSQFNIFEALGVVRRELSHSNFLAFLLDPFASHNLRDLFLRKFLQEAVSNEQTATTLSAIDFDLMDLTQADVARERGNIDILVTDTANRLAVIVENKIDSKQHNGQLAKYFDYVSRMYPEYEVIGILLNPNEEEPDHNKFVSLSQSQIRLILTGLLARSDILLIPPVRSALAQYEEMLGRHLMEDDKINALCIKIYKRHKQAIDLIRQSIPDEREAIADHLKTLVASAGFELDESTYAYARFIPPKLDIPFFRGGVDWTSSGRIFLFEFHLRRNHLLLRIQMAQGAESKRAAIHQFALEHQPPFSTNKTLSPSWQKLYGRPFLIGADYMLEDPDLKKKITEKWQAFLQTDLPAITKAILGYPWPESS